MKKICNRHSTLLLSFLTDNGLNEVFATILQVYKYTMNRLSGED